MLRQGRYFPFPKEKKKKGSRKPIEHWARAKSKQRSDYKDLHLHWVQEILQELSSSSLNSAFVQVGYESRISTQSLAECGCCLLPLSSKSKGKKKKINEEHWGCGVNVSEKWGTQGLSYNIAGSRKMCSEEWLLFILFKHSVIGNWWERTAEGKALKKHICYKRTQIKIMKKENINM